MKKAIINARIFSGDITDDGVIIVENNMIIAVQQAIPAGMECINLNGLNIAAGFIDIQINGGEKYYFTKQPDEATINDMYDAGLKYGTTHILPCLISTTKENILAAIDAVKKYREKYNNGVMGMHLEGPFLNPKKKGAHDAAAIRTPTNHELAEIIRYGKDVIKVITIAPECFTDEQIDMLLDSGIIISLGHTEITFEQAQYYFSKGIHLVTHLFNAMTQFSHREPGLTGASLYNENVFTPVILDGAHCDYAAASIAWRIKKDKFFLITDSSFLGRQVKEFEWGQFNLKLHDGFYRNKDGSLAGASISMAEALQNAITHLNVSLTEAVNMATATVAKALGMDDKIGLVKKGYPATFAVFNNDFSKIESLIL